MTFAITNILIPLTVAFFAGLAVADWRSSRPPRWVKLLSLRHRRRAAALRRLHASQGW